jgi:biotin transporter BioY
MLKGKIIWGFLPMAMLLGWLGQTIHERKRLYPNIFLVVVVATLARFAYDVFFK